VIRRNERMKVARLSLTALAVTLALMVPPSYASDTTDNVCTAGGYFSGAEDRFLSGLAMHIRVKKGILNDAKCLALWEFAYEVGARLSRSGKYKNPGDAEVAKKAAQFAARAYDAVLKNMNLP